MTLILTRKISHVEKVTASPSSAEYAHSGARPCRFEIAKDTICSLLSMNCAFALLSTASSRLVSLSLLLPSNFGASILTSRGRVESAARVAVLGALDMIVTAHATALATRRQT